MSTPGLNAGDLFAILRLKDEMTPAMADAQKAATKALDDVGVSSDKAAQSAKDAFGKIKDAIEDPIPAAKELATSFAEGLGGMAVVAVAAVAAIAAIGVAVYELASKAAEAGSRLDDLADKTGITVPSLTHLTNAATVAGTSIDQIANAVFMLERNMADAPDKVAGGFSKIGLSVEEVDKLNPDEKLLAIAEGLKGIVDPSDRASAVMAIFGRQGRDLLPVLMDLDAAMALTADIEPWTADQAADAEKFSMQMASLKVHAEELGIAIGRELIPVLQLLVDGLSTAIDFFVRHNMLIQAGIGIVHGISAEWGYATAAYRAFRGENEKLPAVSGNAAKGLNTLKDSAAALAIAIHKPGDKASVTAAFGEAEVAGKDLAAEHATLKKSHDDAAAAAKKHATEMEKLTGEVRKLEGGLFLIPESLHKIGTSFDESKLGKIADEVGRVEENAQIANFEFRGMVDNLKNVGQKGEDTAAQLKKIDDAFAFVGPTNLWLHESKDTLGELSGAFSQLAQISGGTFGGLVKDIGQVVSTLGIATKSAIAFTDGLKVDSDGKRDWGSVAAGAVGMVGAMDQATSSTSRWKATFSGAATGAAIGGKVFPVIGTWVGAAAGALVGFFRSAGAAERAINPIREQFVQLHGGLAQLDAEAHAAGVTLTAMLNAKNAEQYQKAIDDLNAALGDQKQDAADLDAAIQKYGFSIEELGPKMRRQQLDDQAKGLLNDWRLLIDSGIGLTVVNEHMADKMREYIDTARTTGTEVPAAMKPVLQSMLDQGLFTDEAGDKITDLEGLGVTFSETMTQGFDRVVKKLGELIDRLGMVPKALDNIPTSRSIDVTANVRWNVPEMPRGADHDSNGAVYAALGADLFPGEPRGTDIIPAWLTPGEAVLNTRATSMLGADTIHALNAGRPTSTSHAGASSAADDHLRSLRSEVAGLRTDLAHRIPQMNALAVKGALQTTARARR